MGTLNTIFGIYSLLQFASAFPTFQRQIQNFAKVGNAGSCPEVKPLPGFNIFAMLGAWHVVFYYSSSEGSMTYRCMTVEFGLSRGYMDMRMRMTYKYANDPTDEIQTGNMTWQIPDPRRPEHWRHTEDPYIGIYNTDVIDTDYSNWLLLLHCSDGKQEKQYLSAFILSRNPILDRRTSQFAREKVLQVAAIDSESLFPVTQKACSGDDEEFEDDQNQLTFFPEDEDLGEGPGEQEEEETGSDNGDL